MTTTDWFKRTYPQFKDEPGEDHWIDQHDDIEFRYHGTELDEIVAKDVKYVHFECMDIGSWWMVLHTQDGKEFHVNLGVKRIKSAGERRDEIWVEKNLTNWAFHEEDSDD